jgi:hypothetical protein
LYSGQADYVGLGCLNPSDPDTIYLSTTYDPRESANFLGVHEIFKGVTTNHGATFAWTPITRNSTRDNLRPIVPAWGRNHTALLWWRGTYNTALSFDTAVVGIIERHSESVAPMTYVDAGTNNTFFAATGAPLVLSSAANQWHLQTGVGNGGTILSSADSTGETPPPIMTQAILPGPGSYDVWVDFWGNPSADWRMMTGLTVTNMQTFRSDKCAQVQPWIQDADLILTNTSPSINYLYQAYVGRVVVSNNYSISVLVCGNAIQTGTTNTLVGDTCRTWYDGVSFAKVEPLQIKKVYASGPSAISLVWNSPPPELSLTTPTYTVQKTSSLNPPISWTTVATGIPATSKAYTTTNVDNAASGSTAFYRITWP